MYLQRWKPYTCLVLWNSVMVTLEQTHGLIRQQCNNAESLYTARGRLQCEAQTSTTSVVFVKIPWDQRPLPRIHTHANSLETETTEHYWSYRVQSVRPSVRPSTLFSSRSPYLSKKDMPLWILLMLHTVMPTWRYSGKIKIGKWEYICI